MEYRKPLLNDFQQVVDLQHENLISVIDPSQKEEGFLATDFSAEDFKTMNDLIGVVVCVDEDVVCGYLCASTVEFNYAFPFPREMINRCRHIMYQNKPLMSHRVFVVGPGCIAQKYRGGDVFLNLCKTLMMHIPSDYEYAISLIAKENKRSFYANQKLNCFEVIDQFELNGRAFWVVIYSLDKFRGFVK